MITTVSDKEIAQATEIESLRQEITAWSVTAENLEAERDDMRDTVKILLSLNVAMAAECAALASIKDEAWEAAKGVRQRLEAERDALKSDAARWVYWRDYHGFSGYFDEGATASPESADIDAACDAAMKRVQP